MRPNLSRHIGNTFWLFVVGVVNRNLSMSQEMWIQISLVGPTQQNNFQTALP